MHDETRCDLPRAEMIEGFAMSRQCPFGSIPKLVRRSGPHAKTSTETDYLLNLLPPGPLHSNPTKAKFLEAHCLESVVTVSELSSN